jgi:hypothetical protein
VTIVPRSLDEILAQAEELADAFEAYEPDAAHADKASSLVVLRMAAVRRADADRAVPGGGCGGT